MFKTKTRIEKSIRAKNNKKVEKNLSLFFVKCFDELAVCLEGENLGLGFFTPEEEAFGADDTHLIGHLLVVVADIDFVDIVLGEEVCDGVLDGIY